ncbi:hypothetical protein FD815_23225 [Klebsiella pneumoniae]|nr:hypothetical protein [Klebsiella pneumoniae]RFC01936.1 hypothetical protein DDJ70_31010 [Klebsiella michiganensis]HAJ2742967.1 hypothetical protein [Escherichia coli]HBX4002939.1 hypothetical protein [Klebsiella variicola]MBX4679853.1 hypothetical protein [Klebsiella pneumoniae]
MTHLTVTNRDFIYCHYSLADNKQPYNHVIKLPDSRSGEIRFLRYCAVSGSVPRSGNNHTALLWG